MSRLSHAYACYYYNKGLERARVRDIYGAVSMLRRSIEMDKTYIEPRNLLGLCLFEVGEVGEALTQWIISKNIEENNPLADYFINNLRANPGRLSGYRAAIRKFNSGLELMKQGSDDLALIQLKKAVSKNPNYVRAWQILALLYMRNKDYTRARKCLRRSLKTDIANPDSLRYLKSIRTVRSRNTELSVSMAETTPADMNAKEITDGSSAKQTMLPRYSYEEGKPDYRVFISLVTGILIGIFVVYYLIVPGVKQSMKQETAGKEIQYGNEIASYLTQLDSLEKENSALQSKLEMEELAKDSVSEQAKNLQDEKYYENVLGAYVYYLDITEGGAVPGELEIYLLKQKMLAVTENEKQSAAARTLYDRILESYPELLSASISGQVLLEEGKRYYDQGDYSKANEFFLLAYGEAPDNDENLYLLGRTYQLTGSDSKALLYYREYIEKFPEGEYTATVNQWIAAIEG